MVEPNQSYQNSSTDQSTEDLKTWLLSSLIIELNFDEAKIAEVEQRLDKCSDRQIRILVNLYKDRLAKRDQAEAARQQYMQQSILNQAQLDLQSATAYRNFLDREHKETALQRERETNLVRQNIQNQNRFMFGGGYGNYGGYRNGFRRW